MQHERALAGIQRTLNTSHGSLSLRREHLLTQKEKNAISDLLGNAYKEIYPQAPDFPNFATFSNGGRFVDALLQYAGNVPCKSGALHLQATTLDELGQTLPYAEMKAGQPVLLLVDVADPTEILVEAVTLLRHRGAEVTSILCIVASTKTVEKMKEINVSLRPLFLLESLLETA
jgi:hypothetical protein